MAAGRPTDYRPEYVDLAKQVIGIEGKSITQFARDLSVARQTIYQWAEDNAEFSDALTCARDWSEAFWEDKMVGFMTNREVNAPLVKLYMANRFRWSDKVVEDSDSAGNEATPVNVNINVSDARTRD